MAERNWQEEFQKLGLEDPSLPQQVSIYICIYIKKKFRTDFQFISLRISTLE